MAVHGEGELLGEPFRPPGWLRRALFRIYEYDPRTYERTVREALIVGPKGIAKTEGVGGISLFELAGPCMPGPDGPVMRTSPNIPVAAASYEQAGRLFNDAAINMVNGTPDKPGPLAAFIETFDGEMQLRHAPGRLFRVAAVAGTNDGGLPTAFCADEIHEWTGRKARVHMIIGNSLEKRGGLLVNITTPDDADPESLLGKKVEYGERVAAGEIDDPGFYYLRYSAPEGCPLDTAEQVRAAILAANPAEWVRGSEQAIERIARKLLVDRIPEHEFRRYWLGQFVPAAGHWILPTDWQACLASALAAAA